LVHYLLLERSDRRADDVPAFLAALATGAPSATAFEQAFRVEMATIDTTLARYMQRMAFPAIRIEDVTAQLRTLTAERMLESDVDRLRGQLFLRLPDLPNADEALTRALARNPDSPATRVALARLRLVAHEALEAIELLAPATTAGSGDATALVTLGRAQQQARRFDQALATFTRATLGDASG